MKQVKLNAGCNFDFMADTKFTNIYSRLDGSLLWSGECENFVAAKQLSDAFQKSFEHGKEAGFCQIGKAIRNVYFEVSKKLIEEVL